MVSFEKIVMNQDNLLYRTASLLVPYMGNSIIPKWAEMTGGGLWRICGLP